MIEMAISEQCSRESNALRSDYYSTAKKTANPLNEWWTTTARRADGHAHRAACTRACAARSRCIGVARLASRPNQRNTCGTGVYAMREFSRSDARAIARTATSSRNDAIERSPASRRRSKKNFHRPVKERRVAPKKRSARANRCK
jgi:hypothetical protein